MIWMTFTGTWTVCTVSGIFYTCAHEREHQMDGGWVKKGCHRSSQTCVCVGNTAVNNDHGYSFHGQNNYNS
jgi:hypothetical protein